MSTIDACRILTIMYSLPVVTNMMQKQNEHYGCMWNCDNQALTSYDHKTWHRSIMSMMDACRILTIKHSLAFITNMTQKHNEHHVSMWDSDNQALTSCDHNHGTETEWALCMHVEFWQSSTHILWSQTWHRSKVSTRNACGNLTIKHSLALITNMAQKQNEHMHACGILTIKHSLALITNIAQKQNEHHACIWNSDNQALTCCNHKHGTEAKWAPCMHACRILTIRHSQALITNMAQKQNEHHRYMQNSDNQALTRFDHKYGIEAEWAPCMHMGFWQSSTHLLWSQTWHRSRMSTTDACRILTIKHSLALITNMAQKHDEHHGCI